MVPTNMYIQMYFTGEGQEDERISFKELRARVTILASALKKLDVKKGDRVAGMKIGFQHCKIMVSCTPS